MTGGERAREQSAGSGRVDDVSAVLYARGEGTPVRLQVLRHPRGRRIRRAFAGLGLLWLLAAVSVFIPIAHLILVPGFFFGGIGLFVIRWRRKDRFEPFEACCPVCGETGTWDLEESAELPLRLHCPSCEAALILKAPS